MQPTNLDRLTAEVAACQVTRAVGRVIEVARGTLLVTGLNKVAALGDQVFWAPDTNRHLRGEVIRLSPDGATVMPAGPTEGISIGDRIYYDGKSTIAPDNGWLGRIVDPYGKPIDDRPLLAGLSTQPIMAAPPPPARRRPLGARLETGLAVFNTFLPIVRGQRLGLFAGSGVGKSMLLADLANGLEADIVVIALVGERGREVREFVDRVFGVDGMKRTVVVAATSDQSPLVRRRCVWTATAVAEYFRDRGNHVLLLADSMTRFAEAHREVALAAGEAGALRGFPPSNAHTLMAVAERAGPGTETMGDITAIFTVLVAGSDMDEPISDIMRGVLDGHVILDREIAERGRFPAIDLLRSVSRSLPRAATDDENKLLLTGRRLLGAYDRAEMMIQAGLYNSGSDSLIDEAVRVWPMLDGFISEKEPDNSNASFSRLRAYLDASA